MALPDLIPTFPVKTGAAPHADPDEFYKTIKSHGLELLWEQATPCPCQERSETGDGRFGCSVCDGTGWEYQSALTILGVVTGLNAKDSPFQTMGRFEFGDIVVSVPPEQAPGFMDRYTLVESCMVMQDLVKRTGAIDKLRWPVAKRPMLLDVEGAETEWTGSVLRLRRQNADGTAGALLEVGTDFEVTADGRIDWALGDEAETAPAVGQRYAVRYYAHPRYVVMDRHRAVRDTTTRKAHGGKKSVAPQYAPLPVASLCRLDWERRT